MPGNGEMTADVTAKSQPPAGRWIPDRTPRPDPTDCRQAASQTRPRARVRTMCPMCPRLPKRNRRAHNTHRGTTPLPQPSPGRSNHHHRALRQHPIHRPPPVRNGIRTTAGLHGARRARVRGRRVAAVPPAALRQGRPSRRTRRVARRSSRAMRRAAHQSRRR